MHFRLRPTTLSAFLTPQPIFSTSGTRVKIHTHPVQAVRRPRKRTTFPASSCSTTIMGNANSSSQTSSPSRQKAADVLTSPKWPESWPYTDRDFQRQDETNDDYFYDEPRIVYHIDNFAVRSLTKYYGSLLQSEDMEVLDLCSSWVSHYPEKYRGKRVVGLGMNKNELEKNPVLTEYVVQDLNVDTKFPFPDESFDLITNTVSVDYLVKPLEVFKEMKRVLKPGGKAVMAISNRCFPTKAWRLWLSTGDMEHIFIVGSFFHFAGGFDPPTAVDISPNFGITDPLYIVQATRSKSD